jgi:hypothetical protein
MPPSRRMSALLPLAGLLALVAVAPRPSFTAPSVHAVPDRIDYNYHVRPILSDRCFLCHGPDRKARKAGLRLDTREGALSVIVPGKPNESELVQRITASDDKHMPPRKSNLSLRADEIAILRRWIAQGAEYKPHWAYVRLPESVSLPAVSDPKWPAGGIDRFILARLERDGLRPSPAASREDWIRRVSFDLTGLPPKPAEVDDFLADHSPGAFGKVVDRLLASRHFGERLALEWIDVARYADSFGYQSDADSNVWPWRDWVIEAFNRNLSFDRFITWQIAGDLLAPQASSALRSPAQGADAPRSRIRREQRLATAFCRLHRMTGEGGSIPEEFRNEYVSDRVHTFGTVFLGLTLECTRCHDHKYDPFTQRDYYSLGAFFNSIDEWGTYDSSAFRPTPTLPLPTPEQEKHIADLEKKVAAEEQALPQIRRQAEPRFQAWLKGKFNPVLPGLVGHFPLDRVEAGNRLANRANKALPGSTAAANAIVPAPGGGKALRFTGDDPANFPGVLGNLDRHQPYTVVFRLHLPKKFSEAIVFHRTAGTDTGFHGTELKIENGRLFFALVRFWPGNAIAVRTNEELPVKQWLEVAVRHDATGKASGLHISIDGKPAASEIVRDNLTKDTQASGSGLTFGERFRSPGLAGGSLGDLRVFNRVLSDLEIAHIHDDKALVLAHQRKQIAPLRDYYLAAIDGEVIKAGEHLRQARQRLFAAQTAVFEIMAMQEMPTPRPAYVLKRGEYDATLGKPLPRNTPASLPAFPKDVPRNRLGLARWLTDPNHPLTARVAVNRYWQMFFGRGLVATTENVGVQGARPTHPELLDWLARDFVASGWDVKGLCRKIVLSSTYRQQSAASAALRERDPDNLLLARAPARRLTGEMLRDAALSASGLLVERIGGPPVKPYAPPGLWRGQNAFLPAYVEDRGEGLYRRSMYTFWRRTSPPPNMLAFDVPTREVCVVRRQSTSTPLQPLVLLNDPQFVEAARALGERMLRQGGKTLDEQLTFAFRLACTRRPGERELELLKRLYTMQRKLFHDDPAGAKAFLRTGNNPAPADLDADDLAAAGVTASTILNLDAATMTR